MNKLPSSTIFFFNIIMDKRWTYKKNMTMKVSPVEVGAPRDLTVPTSMEVPHRGTGVYSGWT